MTNVIAFSLDRKTGASRERGADETRIILFTGVRYVREEAEAEEPCFQAAEPSADSKAEAVGKRLQA